MGIPKPEEKKICSIACRLVSVSPEMVFYIWKRAYKYNSWDLATFMVDSPEENTIFAARFILNLSGVLK